MPARNAVYRARPSHRSLHLILLAGVSALALLAPVGPARARNILVTGGGASAVAAAEAAATAAAQQQAAAATRALNDLSRATQAIQAARQAQSAAANLVLSTRPAVPNGVVAGGLMPVANPVPSAQDTTGLNTWDGAQLPISSTTGSGHVNVTVNQTQTNAVLSWQSFNIGSNTTLIFNQQGNASWIALNRVVGNATAPSQILGSIKADGTVLVINQNGIIFGTGSQVNVNSLMAGSLDVGRQPNTIQQRNQEFLQDGLLGYADDVALNDPGQGAPPTFSALSSTASPGAVTVQDGASITTTGTDGTILLMAPQVTNDGTLSAPEGQVMLLGVQGVTLEASNGSSSAVDPNVRGLVVGSISFNQAAAGGYYVWNQADGLIEADQGNITLQSAQFVDGSTASNWYGGAAINDGVLASTTSVSRNGSIYISAAAIQLSSNSLISIGPDSSGATIPQDPASLGGFKTSVIKIGNTASQIDMQSNAFLYAPSADVTIGTPTPNGDSVSAGGSRLFIDSGAVIDVAGLTDVEVPATQNEIVISPVTANDLRDSPLYRGLLDGEIVYLDPRVSGVSADGVAWTGSPLIDATAYDQLIGVTAAQLMTKGGNVTLGVENYSGTSTTTGGVTTPTSPSTAPDAIVKPGAIIDISGGWVTYEAGTIRTSMLLDASGHIVDISNASPYDTYIGLYEGFTDNHPAWGIKETYVSPLFSGSQYVPSYTEGRDAGTLTLLGSVIAFDGTLYGQAYAGQEQLVQSQTGTGTPTVAGDQRAIQAAPSQLPAGGMLYVNEGLNDAGAGGSDILVTDDPTEVPADLTYGQNLEISSTGVYTINRTRDPASLLPSALHDTVVLSDAMISNAGLSEVSLDTTGQITIPAGAAVNLAPGGVFNAAAGRTLEIDGSVSAPGGKIHLETDYSTGSMFIAEPAALGSYDVVINGILDVAGRWVNDDGVANDAIEGSAWLNGGSISIYAASRILIYDGSTTGMTQAVWGEAQWGSAAANAQAEDISGSILINPGSLLDLTGGGRIGQQGQYQLTGVGGNLSLESDASYFWVIGGDTVDLPGFRVEDITGPYSNDADTIVNPSQINARIAIDPASVEAHGFGGGGTFSLITPAFDFGSGTASTGTVLPLDFFQDAGFASYSITSYKTDLIANTFTDGLNGYNAVLATQTPTIAAGQTLSLIQSVLPVYLTAAESNALLNLASGGDVLTAVTPYVPTVAWDQKPVSLTLSGLQELHVDAGGSIIAAAGSSLTVSKLLNAGLIRMPGGTIIQQEILPSLYTATVNGAAAPSTEDGVYSLSDIFSTNPDGTINPNAPNAMGLTTGLGANKKVLTNAQVAGDVYDAYAVPIYLLGTLSASQGVVLEPGSVTDLSGAAIPDPYPTFSLGEVFQTGRIVAGGTLSSPIAALTASSLFRTTGSAYYNSGNVDPVGFVNGGVIVTQAGSLLNLSGAAATFDEPTITGYVATPQWSDAGSLYSGTGVMLASGTVLARGGAPEANGGTLSVVAPILAQQDPATPTLNVISEAMIADSGFTTLIAMGGVTTSGDVTLQLGRAFYLQESPTNYGVAGGTPPVPVISTTGKLTIDAPYIVLDSEVDAPGNPAVGTVGTGSVTLQADQIDITGAVLFDQSVANAVLDATGDIRLIGIQPWQVTYGVSGNTAPPTTLTGSLAVNGNLTMIAGQIYPTTGSTFTISSLGANATITFGRSGTELPAAPYSAGASLLVQAANIVQGGVLRVPFGSLTLGGDSPYSVTPSGGAATPFAPATNSVTLAAGGVTSVSADGLDIPYGTTTDQEEWYFAQISTSQLTAPPAKMLTINGTNITIAAGATADLSGGGDVYAYEFIPGTGGSHDVLSLYNTDQYSSDNGYQYPDGRQVYAIVPGLSSAPAAAYDPIYSANYANLYGPAGVGTSVWLAGGNGLAAGWYTLLPAQYAMLPGGMRVVQQTGTTSVPAGLSTPLPDGSLLVAGYFGNAISGSAQSQTELFSVESQSVIESYSNIALTPGTTLATQAAATAGTVVPRLGIDAGRLLLNPLSTFTNSGTFLTAPAAGGAGMEVDVSGTDIDIVSTLAGAPADGAIHITADGLDSLDAQSILIGGTRTDNADATGTTSLSVTAQTILVDNDAANPLSVPEIIFAVDDLGPNPVASSLTLANGATIIATGTLSDPRSGDYIINGQATLSNNTYVAGADTATGALVRVSNGPQRLVERLTNSETPAVPAASLTIGSITASGQSIGLDTSSNVSLANTASLSAANLMLSANAMQFTAGSAPSGVAVITPSLQAVLAGATQVTLESRTSIGFDNGTYQLGSVELDAGALVSDQGGAVTLDGGMLTLDNAAGGSGTAAGGAGTLSVNATQITFGTGTLTTSGFGAVTLDASQGMFAASHDPTTDKPNAAPSGATGVFNTANAALTLVTPYLGDRAVTGSQTEVPYNLTLTTTGALAITSAGTNPAIASQIPGLPGLVLTLQGNAITVSGSVVRASAGTLTLQSADGIVLSNGATVEAPGYVRTFGDPVDPVTRSAPGGTLTLSAQGSAGITLGDATVSVGGGSGQAGTLSLSAPDGSIDFGSATLNGTGGTGGSFALDTLGSADLAGLNTRMANQGFTGGFTITTEAGNLTLAAGQTITATAVSLTANNGLIDIAGTIDTHGINGGDVSLYGTTGVTLEGTARIEAYAIGYAADDTRQASGGAVVLGTDFLPGSTTTNADGSISGTSGAITVASGAVIDVSAKRPSDRLVPFVTQGIEDYYYAQGDQGGTVTFRAPIVGDSVNVAVANAASVVGAREIDLEAFKRWDLGAVAASNQFTGVSLNTATGTITLDVTAGLDTANPNGTMTTVAGLNFLGDSGPGTLVDFVQNFNVSADDGNLGGLASQANFQARPGIDLDYAGNVVLASNWNLGAGAVNVTGAEAAGLMKVDPTTGETYVVPGDEGALLAGFTNMLYRVGGVATGAAPIVTLRAGGNLHLEGSVTDGFFEFRDQYDPTYQKYISGAGGSGSSAYTIQLDYYGANNGPYENYADYITDPDSYYDGYGFFYTEVSSGAVSGGSGGGGGGSVAVNVPFSALGNSPAALGAGPGGTGDPIGNAEVDPLLPNGGVMASSTYRLVAGASLPSANPYLIAATETGNLIVDGPKPQPAVSTGSSTTVIEIDGKSFDGGQAGFDSFLESLFPGLTGNVDISLNYGTIPAAVKSFVNSQATDGTVTEANFGGGDEVDMSLTTFAAFVYNGINGLHTTTTATAPSLAPQTVVRTGTGSISLAASGNVDLTGDVGDLAASNGSISILYLNASGASVAVTANGASQLGGASIYTAGYSVQTSASADVFSNPPSFNYVRYGGVVVGNVVYLEGGGDVSVTAGGDVEGRHDYALGAEIASLTTDPGWIGPANDPWVVDAGSTTSYNVQTAFTASGINPALFRDGLGTLGGGNIAVTAGGSVSDLTTAADTSMVMVPVSQIAGPATQALATLGGGNVAIMAGANILGAHVDVGSGTAALSAGGSIGSGPAIASIAFGSSVITNTNGTTTTTLTGIADETFLRINDATADFEAQGSITLQGVGLLATGTNFIRSPTTTTLATSTNYSPNSGVTLESDGNVWLINNSPAFATGGITYALSGGYPGTLIAASIAGNVNIQAGDLTNTNSGPSAGTITMASSPYGQLQIFAGGNIDATTLAMLDSDPGLGGFFAAFDSTGAAVGGTPTLPAVLPTTTDQQEDTYHQKNATHAGDPEPVYLYAGNDIGTIVSSDGTGPQGVTLWVPKQARIYAGKDIINMMFFGQNLNPTDVTRVVAGRDITATTTLMKEQTGYILQQGAYQYSPTYGASLEPAVQGNTFVIGGPGNFIIQAGRNLGPFLNSATVDSQTLPSDGAPPVATVESYGGGILSVGNSWNPYLPATSASVSVLFGVAQGADYNALREAYLTPGAAGEALGNYDDALLTWMQQNQGSTLVTDYGTANVSTDQAYSAFLTLPEMRQQLFLVDDVYFPELAVAADPTSPSYKNYARGYTAVNTLFPASWRYTANNLGGGSNGANAQVHTGDLDLRLATIQTEEGGSIYILGPGGRVIAGSVVSTSQQAARRSYDGATLFTGSNDYYVPSAHGNPTDWAISSIPSGYEGVLTLQGGNIDSFTDGDFLLNQSRVFTEQGGAITMWSSNADINAGQGPKTSADFPPIVVNIDQDAYISVYALGGVTGAGIATLETLPGVPAANVDLLAPRGTVDAGSAGIRYSGEISIAALHVANADNIQGNGPAFGIPTAVVPNIGSMTAASNAAGQAEAAAAGVANRGRGQPAPQDLPSIITVEVIGYGGGDDTQPQQPQDDRQRKRNGGGRTESQVQDPDSPVQVIGGGRLRPEQQSKLTPIELRNYDAP